MASYRAVQLEGKGGLDRLRVVELPIPEPGPGEVRVRVRACGVGFTDVVMRRGYYPYRPPFPFVPGYEVVGEVEALGPGAAGLRPGQRVAALTVSGGYGELLVRRAEDFVPVPDGPSDAEAVALILNYVTAYQMIHRVAELKPGQTALVTGANGGVGQAMLELLRLHGCRALGAAAARRHDLVRALGGIPVESRAAPIDVGARAAVPEGVDASFDALGGRFTGQCLRATQRGGWLVGYGGTASVTGGGQVETMAGFATLFVGARLRSVRSSFYGITTLYRKDPRPFREDLPRLFSLLVEGKLRPRIAATLPLLDGARAQQMLEAGGVEGKLVLAA